MLDIAVPAEWKRQWNDFVVHFQDPFKLRVTMLSIVVAVGLLGIYRPMNAEIAILRRDLKIAQERLTMIKEIDHLRSVRVKLLENFPERGEVNFWSEYLLGLIRQAGVHLRTLDSSLRKTKVGKLQGAYFDIEVSGRYDQIHSLISSIETSKYFARIVKMRFKSDNTGIEGKVTLAVLVASQDKKPDSPAKAQSPAGSKAAPQKGAKAETQKKTNAETSKEAKAVPTADESPAPESGKPAVSEGAHGN
jgi:hypothetical protein